MRKKYNLNLDFARDIRAQRNIVIKEQDSITFEFNIFDDGVPVVLEGHEVRLFIRKADGTMLYQLDNYTVNAHTVVFNVNRQSTTCPGLCYGELEFIKEEDKEYVTTKSFIYKVENKVVDIKGALESVDDVYFLREVEEFIAQAKIDIAEYKETVANIEAQIEEANERLEQLDIDLKEADFTLNESKNNALNEIAQTKDESLEELNQTKDNCVEEITNLKDISVNEITNLKNDSVDEITNLTIESIDSINSKSLEEITKIEDLSEESINKITTLRDNSLSEIDRFKEDSLDEMDTLRDEIIENIDDFTVEHIEEIQNTVDSLLPVVEEGRVLKVDLTDLNKNANSLKNALYNLYDEAFMLNATLQTTTNNADKRENELRTLLNESIIFKTSLDKVLQDLESENIRAEENIATLQELHPEADIRIETLRNLIEEAKRYEQVVRRWIDENGDGNIATEEVLLALETLKASVEEINLKFENYYTKEETYSKEEVDIKTNEAIEIANEALEKAVYTKGEVGVADYSPLPSHVKESLEANIETLKSKVYPSTYGNIIGYTVWKARYQSYDAKVPTEKEIIDSARYLLTIYTDKIGSLDKMKWYKALDRGKCYEIKYKGTITSTQFMYGVHTFNYTESTDTWGAKFELVNNLTEAYVSELYYSDVPVYKDSSVAEIHKNIYDPSIPSKISDFNEIKENGAYKVDVSEAEAVDLYNVPIEGALKGVLIADSYGDITKQTYTRHNEADLVRTRNGSEWSGWKEVGSDIDLSSIATKEEVNEIKKDVKLLSTYGNIQDVSNTPTNGIISNFDEALEYKEYKVISGSGNITNSPIKTPFNGVLKVSNLDNHIILQELTSDKGEVYTRIFNTNSWSEWSASGGGSDIDLSNYTTTSDVENMINTMIEAPKLNIINNLNDIIGGM